MNLDRMQNRIETERLVMFPFTRENISLFNRDLREFEKTFGIVYDGEELNYLLKEFLTTLERVICSDTRHYLVFTEYLIVLKENDHVIGSIGYEYTPRHGVTEVGYGLNPHYRSRGYMTEALTAFLEFGKTLGIRTVLAYTHPDNIKSQNVLKRCGFRFIIRDEDLWWEKDLD